MNRLSLLLALPLTTLTAVAADPSLTIYNQNFVVVRETVPLELKTGVNELRFNGVTTQLEPSSVILRDPTGKTQIQVLEQNFRNDPVSQQMMLSRFEGQELDFVVREVQKPDRIVRGKVIRSGYRPVSYPNRGGQMTEPLIEVEGKLQFSLPGQPVFPALGDDNILKPELNWKLQSNQTATVNAELGYLTGGMTWSADYNLVAPEKGNVVDLTGWITMQNQTGKTFKNAAIKLMAGDVNKIQPAAAIGERASAMMAKQMADIPNQVTEKSFDEFHLYTLPRAVTLRDNETKQVEFIRANGVKADRIYVYDGAAIQSSRWAHYDPMSRRQNPEYGTESNSKVWVMREFKNSKENGLGIPLPKGRLRFYQRDDDGRLEFIGENEIDHTPKDETVRVYVGNAFDIVGERKRTNFKIDNANQWAEESFEITLRNRKKEPVEVRVVETLYRWVNWEIREKSQDFTKLDSQKIEFRVALKPDEEKKITYLVRYSW